MGRHDVVQVGTSFRISQFTLSWILFDPLLPFHLNELGHLLREEVARQENGASQDLGGTRGDARSLETRS